MYIAAERGEILLVPFVVEYTVVAGGVFECGEV
jgi:hypothetical protein